MHVSYEFGHWFHHHLQRYNINRADKGSRLGPTVYDTVAVEGISVEALIDTGSPVTIASLEMVLKSNRPKEQTDAQWMKSTRK